MPVAITATVLSGAAPAPVQLSITGMTSGDVYAVRGTYGEHSWPVAGGRGTSDGSQVVLIDNRAPFMGDIVYAVTISGESTQSSTVSIDYDVTTVLQDLAGATLAVVEVTDPTDARTRTRRASMFTPAERPDPVPRWDVPLRKAMQLSVEADGDNVAALETILATGAPIVRRNRVGLRDIPPVEILMVMADSDALVGATGTLRRIDLDVQVIGDPYPYQALAAYTWADFGTYYTGLDWTDFTAEWAGSTWEDFNLMEWV